MGDVDGEVATEVLTFVGIVDVAASKPSLMPLLALRKMAAVPVVGGLVASSCSLLARCASREALRRMCCS